MTNSAYHGTDKHKLERMADFFTARLDLYEAHMLKNGDKNYRRAAGFVPQNAKKLLDLGCGTGLELGYIYERLPIIAVTGIDLAQSMLDKLKQKYPEKKLELICGDYFKAELGENIYDAAISCATLHHFKREQKTGLYRKLRAALKSGGVYIESDYMVDEKSRDEMQAESVKLRREQNLSDEEYYHFDIPYTIEDQTAMLEEAGFHKIDITNRSETGATIIAHKQN
jgi:tRNA (cmo5U34)-methyltransferase